MTCILIYAAYLLYLYQFLQGVYVYYQLKERRIGTYDTQDEAASANETARRNLEATVNDVLTPEGITTNVTLAKEAAHLAVHGTPDVFVGFDFRNTGVKQLPSGNWVSERVIQTKLWCMTLIISYLLYQFL